MRPRTICAALAVFGLVAGTCADSAGEAPGRGRPVVERGGYTVLAADFHLHSFFEDGLVSPPGLVLEARRRGLDVFAITNHSGLFAARLGRWFSRRIGGATVLVGQEITARSYHMIAVGIEREIGWRLGAAAAAGRIHAQGGVAIAAHPTLEWQGFETEALRLLDGSELMHPSALRDRWPELHDFYRQAGAAGRPRPGGPAAIGSSDYHGFQAPPACRTYVFVREPSEAGVLEALRARRTVVFGPDGVAYGHPRMIALLAAEPLALDPEPAARGYCAAGAFDGGARLCGWLGLLGLVLFGRLRQVDMK